MKSATRVVVSKLGLIAGLAGIEHGIGEMLQGNVAPAGLRIVAWPGWELFRVLSGEPAMTIIPNLLVTGIVAVLVSLAYLAWATVLAERKHSGLVLILLSVVMLLTGAGYGSALLGLIVGLIATRINAPFTWWRTRLPAGTRQAAARLWPRAYVVCVIVWLLMLPGTIILAYVFGTDNVTPVVLFLIPTVFGALLLAAFAAFAHDSQRLAGTGEGLRVEQHGDKAGVAKAYRPDRNQCIDEGGNTAII